MSAPAGLRLDDWSDRLSPIMVKEVRQMVRGREFNYSFGFSLVVGLLIAFLGGADVFAGSGTAGARTFSWLTACLALNGLIVVPLGAFNALRTERTDQTLDLITHTSLSARRIVIGKLLTQAVKLLVLFAGLAPFVAMSFLLGGVALTTIFVTLAVVFMWSLWACAACLCVSSASQSRVLSSLFFAGTVIVFFMALGSLASLIFPMLGIGGIPRGTGGSLPWWVLAGSTAFCFTSMANLVLLAENRLSLPIEDRTTALRIGFLAQFVLILIAVVAPIVAGAAGYTRPNAVTTLGVLGGLQLALVSIFAVTEDMVLSRRVLRTLQSPKRWRILDIFRPGGGRGAAWVLAQMALLLGVGAWLGRSEQDFLWLFAICGYICFFTGLTTAVGRHLAGPYIRTSHLRMGGFLLLPVLSITAEGLQYLLSNRFLGTFSAYHVLNPFRALANWQIVMGQGWAWPIFVMSLIGFSAYLTLIKMGRREDRNARAAR